MSQPLAAPGQVIDGKYRIVRLLGKGGMGAVYEGENVRIKRRVAIKMLHAHVSTQVEVVARFEREAQAAALVGSQHICEVLDLGELPDQSRYLVMEYLEGETLTALLKKHRTLTPAQALPLLFQVLDALGAAHAAGIIHRDLKPDNIFVLPRKGGATNFVKVLDFGVSKFTRAAAASEGDSPGSMNVTQAGTIVGTPYYMSPEQARGLDVDHRADIYAIGVILYQVVTGTVPFKANTFSELLLKVVLDTPEPPELLVPELPGELSAIILRAMSRDPAMRFPSCADFREALVQFVGVHYPQGSPDGLAAQAAPLFSSSVSTVPNVVTPSVNARLSSTGNRLSASPGRAGSSPGMGAGASSARASSPSVTTANSWGHSSAASLTGEAAGEAPGEGAASKARGWVVAAVVAAAVVLGGAGAVTFSGALGVGRGPAAATSPAAPSVALTASPARATALADAPSPPATKADAPAPASAPDKPAPVAASASATTDATSNGPEPSQPPPKGPTAHTAKPKGGPSKPGTPDLGY